MYEAWSWQQQQQPLCTGRDSSHAAVRTKCVFFSHVVPCRREFPPVAGGVIEDVKFVGNSTVLVAYYGEQASPLL